MLTQKLRENLLQIVNDFINGNLTSAQSAIKRLSKAHLVYLIFEMAPCHLTEEGLIRFNSLIVRAVTTKD